LTLKPTLLGKAASSFYLQYQTPLQMRIEIIALRKNIMKNSLLQIKSNSEKNMYKKYELPVEIIQFSIAHLFYALSHNNEFDELPVRQNEELLNSSLSDVLPWGPDLSKFGRRRKKDDKLQDEMDIFSDPHTKTFLLLQAYITRAKLPINDYINDTRTVIDQVPRLLAAMQFISPDDTISAGSFEVFCLFFKSKANA